jgi:hypothetical protein
MAELLANISTILTAILEWFTSIITWTLSNPILALSIYIPFTMFIITYVFNLFKHNIGHKSKD